mmetsp:Transcript_32044/g.75139  ORF Transcript_32044/g.75139 Transcript_32044/m.75139 type:complete len:558 (+) Transcript_32044:105-1778(+)
MMMAPFPMQQNCMDDIDSPCSIKVKNTFVECDVDEDLRMRNVRSEPTSPTHQVAGAVPWGYDMNRTSGVHSCSLLQRFARTAQLSIDTESDVVGAPGSVTERRRSAYGKVANEGSFLTGGCWPATPEGNFCGYPVPAPSLRKTDQSLEEDVWPSTPEGNFLPCYQRLSLAGRLSSWESVSTSSEAAASSSSWSMTSTSSWDVESENSSPVEVQLPWQGPSPSMQQQQQQAATPSSHPMLLATCAPRLTMQREQPKCTAPAAPAFARAPLSQQALQMDFPPSVVRYAKGQGQSPSEAVAVAAAATASAPLEQSCPDNKDAASTGRLVKAVAIAKVQELLQSSEHSARFKFPPGVKVLQWSYRQHREGRLAHRAVLSFLCNGVPQHVAGEWEVCKKTARQSAAEMALAKLIGRNVATMPENESAEVCVDLAHLQASSKNAAGSTSTDYTKKLEAHVRHCSIVSSPGLSWALEHDQMTNSSRALVKIVLLGMQHTFVGPFQESAEMASAELARRVLWFLGYRTCRGMYVVDRRRWIASACEVPPSPEQWAANLQGVFVSE